MELYLSSSESGGMQDFNIMKKYGNKFYLFSYYNLRKKKNLLEYLKIHDSGAKVFIDSGAHTLQKPGKDIDYDLFTDEYIDFINKYSEYVDYFVELDVENKIGLKKVEEIRDRIIKKTGRYPIVVWHREREWKYYEEMCKKYPIVGFSGFVEDNIGRKEVPDRFIPLFIDEAHKNNCKIHGFGYTRKGMEKLGFDMVDSSSWSIFKRFGHINIFKRGQIVRYKTFKNFKNHYKEMAEWEIKQWILYQQYLLNF